MPLLILMGGEVVVAIVGVRIGLWLLRSWWAGRMERGSPPPDGGGTPLDRPLALVPGARDPRPAPRKLARAA